MHLTVIPTPKAVLLAIAAAGSAWAGAMLGVFALFAFAVAIATLLVLGLLSVFTGGRRSWHVQRTMQPATPRVAESVFVEITATPRRAFAPTFVLFEPTPWGTRRFGLAATLSQKGPVRIGWQVATTTRGFLYAGPGLIFRHDLFSLFRRRVADLPRSEVVVFPRILRFPAERLLELIGVHAFGVSDETEFSDMRTYVPGDDPRRVNWKASARTMSSGSLIVADTKARGRQAEVCVQVEVDSLPPTDWDAQHPDGERETAVSVAASIVNELASHGGDHLGRSEIRCVLEIIVGSTVVHRSENPHDNLAALAVLETFETAVPPTTNDADKAEFSSAAGTILVTGSRSKRAGRVTFRCGTSTAPVESSSNHSDNDAGVLRNAVYSIETLADLGRLLESP